MNKDVRKNAFAAFYLQTAKTDKAELKEFADINIDEFFRAEQLCAESLKEHS